MGRSAHNRIRLWSGWLGYGLAVFESGYAFLLLLFSRKREQPQADRLTSLAHSLETHSAAWLTGLDGDWSAHRRSGPAPPEPRSQGCEEDSQDGTPKQEHRRRSAPEKEGRLARSRYRQRIKRQPGQCTEASDIQHPDDGKVLPEAALDEPLARRPQHPPPPRLHLRQPPPWDQPSSLLPSPTS